MRAAKPILIVAAAVIARPAWAVDPARATDDQISTRALSMGEALRAWGTGAAALYLNPAGMASLRQYVIELDYQYGPTRSAHQVAASIVDSITAAIAAGVFYNFDVDEPTIASVENERTSHHAGLGLAIPFGSLFAIGATGRYLNFDQDAPGGAGTDVSTFTFDAGAVLRPAGGLALGAVIQNLRRDAPVLQRKLGLGAAWAFGKTALIELDSVQDLDDSDDPTAPRYHLGGELFLGESLGLRGGGTWEADGGKYAHGGLAYVTRAAALEAGLRRQVAGDDDHDTLLSFALRLFVQ